MEGNGAEGFLREAYVYKVLGLEVASCEIFVYDEKKSSGADRGGKTAPYCNQGGTQTRSGEPLWQNILTRKSCLLKLVGLVGLAVLCLYMAYNPPAMVYSVLNTVTSTCPERMQLREEQASRDRWEAMHRSAADALTKCTLDKEGLHIGLQNCQHEKHKDAEDYKKARSDLASWQQKAEVANSKILKLHEDVNQHVKTIQDVTTEKDDISGSLRKVQINFGECKNENMNHEISNSDLLNKVASLEKQLEKC